MKDHPVPADFAALIGIDWADKKHDVCEISLTTNSPDYSVISASPKAISGDKTDTHFKELANLDAQ